MKVMKANVVDEDSIDGDENFSKKSMAILVARKLIFRYVFVLRLKRRSLKEQEVVR